MLLRRVWNDPIEPQASTALQWAKKSLIFSTWLPVSRWGKKSPSAQETSGARRGASPDAAEGLPVTNRLCENLQGPWSLGCSLPKQRGPPTARMVRASSQDCEHHQLGPTRGLEGQAWYGLAAMLVDDLVAVTLPQSLTTRSHVSVQWTSPCPPTG